MSYYEKFSFCPIQEYEAWEQYRLSAEDILVDEKYVVMMQLRQQVHKHKALRVPTRIIEIDRRAENIHVVRLNIDIPRLTGSKWHIESEMAEGYLGKLRTTKGKEFTFNGVTATRSYIRGHSGIATGPEDELRNLLDLELGVPV